MCKRTVTHYLETKLFDATWVLFFPATFAWNICSPINTKRVTLEMRAGTRPLMLSDFNQNRRAAINVNKTSGYQISWKFVQRFSSSYMHINWGTHKAELTGRLCLFRGSTQLYWKLIYRWYISDDRFRSDLQPQKAVLLFIAFKPPVNIQHLKYLFMPHIFAEARKSIKMIYI